MLILPVLLFEIIILRNYNHIAHMDELDSPIVRQRQKPINKILTK